jgi:hypothetical protein
VCAKNKNSDQLTVYSSDYYGNSYYDTLYLIKISSATMETVTILLDYLSVHFISLEKHSCESGNYGIMKYLKRRILLNRNKRERDRGGEYTYTKKKKKKKKKTISYQPVTLICLSSKNLNKEPGSFFH